MTPKLKYPPEYQKFLDTYGRRPSDIVFAITRSDTLKEVGEWLDRKNRKVDCLDGVISRGFVITDADVTKFLKGEMPEG